jgi:DnaK suppressor protein
MDPDRARRLLASERERLEQAIAGLSNEAVDGVEPEQSEPGELGSEQLYESERDVGLTADLSDQLAALERAEARLAAGTYGLSIESGAAIPDERLAAQPMAELTVEEQQRCGPG